LTAAQVGERFQVPPSQVYRLARTGQLTVIRIGRYRRFDPRDLEAWLERQRNGGRR
jgi:excisionase family DNA binding protein